MRRIVKWLKIGFVLGVLTFVALYFVLQSEWLYRDVVFPRLAKSVGGKISVGTINIRPWRLIELQDVKFQDESGGTNTIEQLKFHYQLLPLFSGKAVVDELYVNKAEIHLDSFLKKGSKKEVETSPQIDSKKPEEIPEAIKAKTAALYPRLKFLLDLKKIQLENLNIRASGEKLGENLPQTISLNKVDFEVDEFVSDTGGSVEFGFQLNSYDGKSVVQGSMEARVKSKIELQENREKVGLRLDVALSKFKGSIKGVNLDDISMNLGGLINLSEQAVDLSEILLKLTKVKDSLMELAGSAKLELKENSKLSKATFKTKIVSLNSSLLGYIPNFESQIEEGILSGQASGSYSLPRQFALKGELSLDGLKLERSTLNKETPASGNLSFDFNSKDSKYKINASKLQILSQDNLLGDAEFVGDLNIEDTKTTLAGDLNSTTLELDKILSLLPKADSKKVLSEIEKEEKNTNSSFEVSIQANLKNTKYNEIISRDASGLIVFGEQLLKGEDIVMSINSAPLKGSFIISTNDPMYKPTIDLDIRKLEIQPIVRSIDRKMAKNLSGLAERVTFRVENSWDPKDVGDAERDGDLRATFKNLKIPAYLQDTPPINLIFLPVKALDYSVGKIGKVLMPSEIVEAVDSLDDDERSGQIEFDEAQIQGLINGKGLTLKNTKFDSDILPTFTFYGPIGFDEKLDLVIGINILKVNVPLPVTGSLSFPLPDIPGFVPAVIRSLGHSVANIGGIFDSKEEKDREFFGDPETSED